MEPRLVQHQTQKLVLSPQIRQYLRLLQLPMTELQQAVEAELAENPLLDEKTAAQEEPLPSSEPDTKDEERRTEELRLGESFDQLDQMDEAFTETYNEDTPLSDPSEMQKKRDFQESLITDTENLTHFLLFQCRYLELDDEGKKIAEHLIGNIDEDGYLRTSLEEIAQAAGSPVGRVAEVLAQIQELDPPGIGARNLQEALLLQLKRKGPEAKLAMEIVGKHFAVLEKRDWKQLAKILAADEGEIQKAANLIGRLEPRPGRTFYSQESTAVTPDATVSIDDENETKLKIEIHDESIPELRINSYYRRLLKDKATDAKTRAFLKEKMQTALNFMKALKLRKSTIHEITDVIVKVQPDFFFRGFSHLKPLRLKDIAQTIGIHESTVSRAIQGKYITTPQGTIPYRSFFSAALATESGVDESQKSVMEKIRRLIEKEDAKRPLSDQEIVKLLKGDGLKIARRTVAKYRDLLKILPSHLRRKK